MSKIAEIQTVLGTKPDGIWGPITQGALDRLLGDKTEETEHHVRASSFADPADIAAFRRCKERGLSDEEAFKYGDNGIGCWGDDTTSKQAMCALPPEDMEERFGSVDAAKHQSVLVEAGERSVICTLADRMPRKKNIHNGAGVDLNPAAAKALGLEPPFLVPAKWRWA